MCRASIAVQTGLGIQLVLVNETQMTVHVHIGGERWHDVRIVRLGTCAVALFAPAYILVFITHGIGTEDVDIVEW